MRNWKRRAISSGLALVLGLTSTMGSLGPVAFAEDTAPEDKGQASSLYEPWKHGYRLNDVLHFDPATDPFADQLRARVPLQERNEAFTATQANPNLESNAMVFNVASGNYRSTDVSNAPWHGNLYYDEFALNTYKFWQYTDLIGAGGRPTSGIDRGTSEKEYGVIGIPIPAFINAAHKNGVKAIAEYFFPRNPQYVEEWLYKDENGDFPYAQKLVDLKEYYGFDGYFINNETDFRAEYVPLFKEMLAWLREQGVYIQMYDGITDTGSGTQYQNRFNSTNSPWVQDSTYGRVSDSLWINYFYYNRSNITDSVAHAQSLGLDPFETLFLGVEAGNGRFIGSGGNGASSTNNLQFIKDETGNPVMSIALWGNDFVLEGYNTAGNNRYKSQYQWQTEERERMWFTSPSEDATDHTPTVDRPDVQVNSTVWRGLSDYISEKSVINGSAFTTNFNNGHGMQYFTNGEVSRNVEWTNMNIQDILPTWQWWIQGEHKDQLDMDWDYGSNYKRILATGSDEVPFDYQQIGAYNGGSSLVVYGGLEGDNFVNLYKTDLEIKADSKISLTYYKPSADDSSSMRLGLVFKNAPNEKVYLPIEDAGKQTNGWKTVELSLAEYAGEQLMAFGVELSSDAKIDNYQVNFGQVKVMDGVNYTPDAPTNFKIDQAFDETGEIELSWDIADYENVKQYNVYAGYADGSERYVGGAYADNLYISTLEDRDNITCFKLKAVGKDGSESEAAIVNYNNSKALSNIRALSKDNKLNVTWDEADGDYDSVKVTLDYFYSTKESASVTVNKGVKSAQLDIPVEDGSRYILTVETVNADGSVNDAVNYFGSLADNYCEPYDGDMRFNQDGSFMLTTPLSSDWKSLTIDFDNGSSQAFQRMGNNNRMRAITMPNGVHVAIITIEDNNGNKSMPVMFIDGVKADLDAEITANFIPDDILRAAIKEKVGPTLREILAYRGALDLSGVAFTDLSGINLMTGLTSLNISGTQVRDLTPILGLSSLKALNASNTQIETVTSGMLPDSLTNIDLSGNQKLSSIEENVLASLSGLETLNITGNAALTVLYLNKVSLPSVNLAGCDNLQELYLTGSAMEELDITNLTNIAILKADNCNLEKLVYADPSAYSEEAAFDFTGAKLDLSAGTPERAFMDAVGAECGSQRPVAYLQELPGNVTVTTNKTATIRMKDYYEACFNKAETVRGTLYSTLEGADWIAADYDVAKQIAMPKNVFVEIIDEDGNVINQPEAPDVPPVDTETNVAREAKVLGGNGQNANERYDMLFDGEDLTKWCTIGSSGWTAFYLPKEISVGKWLTKHAEINSEPVSFNTVDFELQILNTEALGMSEDEFLASPNATSSAILGNDSNWTTIDHVTDNKSMIVERDVEDAPVAKVYRLKINKSINGSEYAAIRVHELELYQADNVARDYEGKLALDKTGLYTVNFMKGKNTLGTMDVRVRAVTSVLEAVIDNAQALIDNNALENTMEAVVTEFYAALESAQTLVDKEDATQAEINAATKRLLDAMAKVDWKQGDKTALEVAVNIANTIKPNLDLYLEAGKQEFVDALAEAEALLASGNAWDDDIKAATTRLIEAMANLRMAANKDILNEMINKANALDLSLYTAQSANAVRTALQAAEALAADENATQDKVDAAANTLQAALAGLIYVNGDSSTPAEDANSNSISNSNGATGTTTPVGDGTTPTKTGDMGTSGLAALMLMSAAGVLFLRKKNKR